MWLSNWSGTASTTQSLLGITSPHQEIAFGMQYFPYEAQLNTSYTGFLFPGDNDWKQNLNMKHKTVRSPIIVKDYNAATPIGIGLGEPAPTKTISWTLKPWRIEKTSRANYMDDDGYQTNLSEVPNTPSSVVKDHFIDCFGFLDWSKKNVNTRMSCKVMISVTI